MRDATTMRTKLSVRLMRSGVETSCRLNTAYERA
jgi:hypothetical protein